MTNQASTTSALPHPRKHAGLRDGFGYHSARGLRRIRRAGYVPLPALEECLERLRGYRSPIAELSAGQWAGITACEGPEILGHRNGPQRAL